VAWLPLYISAAHFDCSWELLRSSSLWQYSIFKRGRSGTETCEFVEKSRAEFVEKSRAASRDFDPVLALRTLQKLLNDKIKNTAQSNEAYTEETVSGLCQVHRLLLELVERDDSVGELVDDELIRFRDGQIDKRECPNLGEQLVLLTLSDAVCWADIAQKFVAENHCRNVRWRKPNESEFESAKFSRQIVSASVGFALTFGRAKRREQNALYGERLGSCTPEEMAEMQERWVAIKRMCEPDGSWLDYCAILQNPRALGWTRGPQAFASEVVDRELREALELARKRGAGHLPAGGGRGGGRGSGRGGGSRGGGRGGGRGRRGR